MNKDTAITFLRQIVSGKVREAFDEHVSPDWDASALASTLAQEFHATAGKPAPSKAVASHRTPRR